GEEINAGDLIQLHSTWVNGETGETDQSTYANGGRPEPLIVNEQTLAPVLTEILLGAKSGMSFAFAVPASETSASVAIGEIVKVGPGRAQGTDVPQKDGLPKVELLEN